MKKKVNERDIYQEFTDKIIEAIEECKAKKWEMPWNNAESIGIPVNSVSGKAYRGINILSLWLAAISKCYTSNIWATYDQWRKKKRFIKYGEKSTQVIFWSFKEYGMRSDEDEIEDISCIKKVIFARTYSVFNECQLQEAEVKQSEFEPLSNKEKINHAENFFSSLPGVVFVKDNLAFYHPSSDMIIMPPFKSFRNALDYYGTLGHEYIHWTGSEKRLARDLSGRFGSDAYAIEELIAELGAAFLSGLLGLVIEPRQENINYIDVWLKVLKSDKKAIFTASAKAQQATDELVLLARDVQMKKLHELQRA